MKKILLLSIFTFFSFLGFGQNKVDIKTSAVCQMCKNTLEYELTFTKGVKNVNLDLTNGILSIDYNPKKMDADQLRKIITMIGYDADSLKRDSLAYTRLPFCCRSGGHEMKHD